mgnify:CR=1 FL=1
MGSRKKIAADKRKEERKLIAIAKLNNCPTSPRKMRLVADVIRGEEVLKALNMLKHMPQDAAPRLEKLVLSALANWQAKNEDKNADEQGLIVKEVFVDSAMEYDLLYILQYAPSLRRSNCQQPVP